MVKMEILIYKIKNFILEKVKSIYFWCAEQEMEMAKKCINNDKEFKSHFVRSLEAFEKLIETEQYISKVHSKFMNKMATFLEES